MNGVLLIAEERERQETQEGWTAEHDAEHTHAELTVAALAYATQAAGQIVAETEDVTPPGFWPWDVSWWKPSDDPIRNLVKAGALIAAEIDRLQG